MNHESVAFSNVYRWTGKTSVNSRYHLLLAQRFHHHVFDLLSEVVNIFRYILMSTRKIVCLHNIWNNGNIHIYTTDRLDPANTVIFFPKCGKTKRGSRYNEMIYVQ